VTGGEKEGTRDEAEFAIEHFNESTHQIICPEQYLN